MLHQNLSDHVFRTPYDIDCYVCGVCGFNLSSLAMNKFGISKDDLFFEEKDTLDSGRALNHDVISSTIKQKYIPRLVDSIEDNTPVLSLIQKEMKEAEKKIMGDLEEDLFRGLKYNEKGEIVKKYSEGLMNPIGCRRSLK